MLFIAVTVAILLVDQATKAAIASLLNVGDSLPVIRGLLHFTHVKNSGGAFGLFQGQRILFFGAGLAVITFVLYLFKTFARSNRLATTALGLILGGVLGNLIDRISTGRVTDFIDIRVWPVFNIADSAIVVGAIVLAIVLFKSPGSEVTMKQSEAERVQGMKQCTDNLR